MNSRSCPGGGLRREQVRPYGWRQGEGDAAAVVKTMVELQMGAALLHVRAPYPPPSAANFPNSSAGDFCSIPTVEIPTKQKFSGLPSLRLCLCLFFPLKSIKQLCTLEGKL